MEFAKSEDERTLVEMQSGQKVHFFPTNKVRIPVDKNAVIKNKVVNPKYYDSIVPYIDIDIDGAALYKNRLIMLDILNNNNWERPTYFSPGSFNDDDYLWMKEYLQLDGMVYKLVPVRTKLSEDNPMDMGQIDTDKMFNLVQKWTWGNGDKTTIYHDPETRKNSISSRTNLSRLMYQLIKEGKTGKAKNIIDMGVTKFPLDYYGYYTMVEPFADGYYKVGEKAKAQDLLNKLMNKYKENLKFYGTLSSSDKSFFRSDIATDIERYRSLLLVMKNNNDLDFYNKNKATFNTINNQFQFLGREME